MKFLAIIPARYASTRFPGKPLAEIGGRPMIEWVYRKAADVFDDCWVATDDMRISEAVQSFGGRVVMTSPSHRSGTDRCREALDKIESSTGITYDVVFNIQGDEPFLDKSHLLLLKGLFANRSTQIGTLVKPFTDEEDIFNPNIPKVAVAKNGHALYFSRCAIPYLRGTEQAEWQGNYPYMKHIGLYAYRSETLRRIADLPQGELEKAESLEQLRWLENGFPIITAITETETIAVDTPEDLEKARSNFSE